MSRSVGAQMVVNFDHSGSGRLKADMIVVDVVDGVEFELDVKGLYR